MTILDDLSALIAFGAALISLLAAVYARRQADAAKRANQIAVHNHRLDVYSALVRFRAHLASHGANISADELWKFAEAVDASEFYFPERIHPQMKYILDESFRLMSLHEDWKTAREVEPNRAPSLVKPKLDLSRELRDQCERIADELKPHLRIGEA